MNDLFMYRLGKKRGGGGGGGTGGGSGGGDNFPIGDGNTHIWLSVVDGATNPVLPVQLYGRLTVDWGDGTEPELYTASATKVNIPHEYERGGDYVVSLIFDRESPASGYVKFLGGLFTVSHSNAYESYQYNRGIRKIEFGSNVDFNQRLFEACYGVDEIYFSRPCDKATTYLFTGCTVRKITLAEGTTKIQKYFANSCTALREVVIPEGVTSIGDGAFDNAKGLSKVNIPNTVTEIGTSAFNNTVLREINIPSGITTINANALSSNTVKELIFPSSVTTISNYALAGAYSCALYDFSNHTSVPSLGGTSVFPSSSSGGVPYEIRVPAALVDEWKAATNWSTHASKIVGV